MLPVTRANLDKICCTCLLDIRPSVFTQKVYDVNNEKNLSKLLKLTAHITVLKNPINQKYINDYCRKVCEICFLKVQYSFYFREKIIASAVTVKDLLENNSIKEEDVEKLQYFCRICLNRQNSTGNNQNNYLKRIKDCSGIRFTTLLETEAFRIKEGTNINEIVVIHDEQFPKQLCQNCLKKLRNVEEFRKLATQSFEYMVSVMGDVSDAEEELIKQEIKQFRKDIIWNKVPQAQSFSIKSLNKTEKECPIYQTNNKNDYIEKNSVIYSKEDYVLECESESRQFHKTVIWESDQLAQLVPNEYNISTNSTKTEISQIQIDNNYDLVDSSANPTVYSAMHLDNGIENDIDLIGDLTDYNDDDPDFSIIDNEESSLTDYDDLSEENNYPKRNSARESKQHDKINKTKERNINAGHSKAVKSKRTQKVKENKQSKENLTTSKCDKQNKNDKKIPFICKECSKTFSSNSTLKRHQKTVHSTRLKNIQEPSDAEKSSNTCQICSKYFKRKHHLTEHIKAVHEKQKPFKCSFCTNSFTSSSSRRVHELIHSGEFPFVCEWCKKGFRRSHQLKIHLERHTTIPELLCPICKRSQKTKEELSNHLKSHDEKRSQCPSCGKLFTSITHLKDHQNAVHLKLRPFKCEFCELAFGDRKTRRVHEKSHTEDRPITCIACKRGFKIRTTFKKHLKDCHSSGYNNNIDNKSNNIST